MAAKLTKKDFEILDYIYRQTKTNGFPPSVREIGREFNLSSTASVYNRIKKLIDAEYLVKGDSKNRALKVINYTPDYEEYPSLSEEIIAVPMYGTVAAGLPTTAIQSDTETFPLPASFVRSRDLFVLKVSGESMINAGIFDGDFIIASQTDTAENGEMVVALVNNREEATVKTFYKENNRFRLQPENDYFEPIITDEVCIIGKVVGVFREL